MDRRSRIHGVRWGRSALVGALAALITVQAVAAPLPQLMLDRAQTTVSGLSSGGYMAVQLHVAWSSLFHGAGVIAAGPYYCAQGTALLATTRCRGPRAVRTDSTSVQYS